MKKSLHIAIKFCIALILLVSVLVGYWPIPEYIVELTCISNFLIGLTFLLSGIRMLKGEEDFSNSVYSTGLVTIMLVFLICMGSLSGMYHMNFKGAFIFLHVINPIIVLVYYLVFIDEKHNGNLKRILITPFFSLIYLLIDYIVGTIVKHFVYGFFKPGELSLWMALVVGVVIYICLLFIGLLAYRGNLLLRKINLDHKSNDQTSDCV